MCVSVSMYVRVCVRVYVAIPLLCSSLISGARLCVCVCVCVRACVSLSVVIAAPLTRFGRRMGRMHSDSEPLKISTLSMSHLLIRSLVCSRHSLACSAQLAFLAPHCVRSLVGSLARSLTRSRARGTVEYFCPIFNVS